MMTLQALAPEQGKFSRDQSSPGPVASGQSALSGQSEPLSASPGVDWSGIIVPAAGGLFTALLLTATLSQFNPSAMSTPSLQAVPITELEAAIGALNVAAADAAIGDARACKVPLAYVTVQGQPGATPGSIRIRSGAYVSPNILVTEAPRRVPMPFPAAYPVGRGIISIEGAAQNLSIWLSPSWHAPSLNGTSPISVVWKPGKAC